MMIGTNEQIVQAFTEVGCILKHFPNSYIEKLPNKLLEFIGNMADRQYIIDIDTNKKIGEQNLSNQAKNILAVLEYNYWADFEQKERLKIKLYENEEIRQNNLSIKYNYDNLLKKNKDIQNEKTEMVKYKEAFYKKICRFFKNTFLKSK